MSDYFTRVVGMLKRHNFHFLGQGSGRYEVWQKFSRNVIVPNRCASRLTANGVMKAAGINFIFSENANESNINYMNFMNDMQSKDELD